jgi:hypothetical protein
MVVMIVAFFVAIGVAFVAFDQADLEEQKNEAAAKPGREARLETERRRCALSARRLLRPVDGCLPERSKASGPLTSLREAFLTWIRASRTCRPRRRDASYKARADGSRRSSPTGRAPRRARARVRR